MKLILKPKGLINKRYLPFLNSNHARRVFFGGSSSGKSVFKAQETVLDVLQGRNYLVVRKVANTLNKSVWNECIKAIYGLGLANSFNMGKSEMVITAKNNGCQILFAGLDDVEKVKSITPQRGVLTDIWIEEATEIEKDDYKQLEKRIAGLSKHIKRITLTFNPIDKTHWIYEEFFDGWVEGKDIYQDDRLLIVKSTHIHNDFLSPDDHEALENESDPYYYNVYTLGNWGVLGDIIFTNWRTENLHEPIDLGGGRVIPLYETFDNIKNGLDFGFSSDPAAIVRCHLDKQRKKIYVFKEFMEKGLTNNLLSIEAKKIIGNEKITCDSAEPKSIAELKGYGIRAVGALKGSDSVVFGIQWLQGYEIIVDVRCIDMRNELVKYQWKKDKDGRAIRQPVDKDNHLIDALRYALEDDMRQRRMGTARMI